MEVMCFSLELDRLGVVLDRQADRMMDALPIHFGVAEGCTFGRHVARIFAMSVVA
jgi:hypothetical protein